jgi:hypothetical protein
LPRDHPEHHGQQRYSGFPENNYICIIQFDFEMTAAQKTPSGLNPIQQSLLRLFNRPMSEEETLQLKRILVQHFCSLLREEVEKVSSEKGYKGDSFENMLNLNS